MKTVTLPKRSQLGNGTNGRFPRSAKNGRGHSELAAIRERMNAIERAQAIMEYELDGTIVSANASSLSLLGVSLEEIQGRPHAVLLDPSVRDTPEYRQFWHDLAEGKTLGVELKRMHKDGHESWLSLTFVPVAGHNGKSNRIIAVITDVTATRKLEARIREAEQREKQLAEELQAKVNWYVDILDAVPFPIHVLDRDMKWVFLNRAFEELMVKTGIIPNREAAPGKPCSCAAANICNTPNCGVRQLERGKGESFFDWHGKKCKQDTRELKNRRGERVGYVEVVQDLTPVLSVQEYITLGVERVSQNLAKLAKGDVSFDVSLPEASEHTRAVRENFGKINADMQKVQQAVQAVIEDAGVLTQAAADGKLSTRADVIRHQGDFRKIVQGVNNTLDVVVGPLNEAAAVLGRIAKGDLTSRMEGAYRGDLAAMKESINTMASDLTASMTSIARNAKALSSAAEELTMVSQQMSSNSEETSAQANVVASASEQVSKNVATVATSAEEMSATAKEIAKSAAEAARVATQAVHVAEDTSKSVNKLGESSVEIGKVIKVITSIAQQTNLLALNATIEAARAGEAGKGFAVVANEVKELAKQTAAATEDISAKIEAIQSDTKSAVEAITQIGSVINQINGFQTAIASAVEEQTATTNEIAHNAGQAANGSTEIAKNIANVSRGARSTSEGAGNTLASASELARLATELKKVVDQVKLA